MWIALPAAATATKLLLGCQTTLLTLTPLELKMVLQVGIGAGIVGIKVAVDEGTSVEDAAEVGKLV